MSESDLENLRDSIADEINRLEVRMATRRSLNSFSTNLSQWAETLSKQVLENIPDQTRPSPTIQALQAECDRFVKTRDRTLVAFRDRTQQFERWLEDLEVR